MKKFFLSLIFIFLFVLMSITIILSTIGIETKRFNNIISDRIYESKKNIKLDLAVIKYKLDLKEISLFLEISNPTVIYRGTEIPIKNIKGYIDFLSIIKKNTKIKKINIVFNKIKIEELKELSTNFKPSNFKSLVTNRLMKGQLIGEAEIYFDNKNSIKNFIARGVVSNLEARILDNLDLTKSSFNFFADKTDVLIKNFYGEADIVKIEEGDLQLSLAPEISIQTNFKTKLNYIEKSNKYLDIFTELEYLKNLRNLSAELNNIFSIDFDNTYKVKKYSYKNNGKILDANFQFNENFKNDFFKQKVYNLFLKDSKIVTNFSEKEKLINLSGQYSLNESDLLKYELSNIFSNELVKLKLNVDYDKKIEFKYINFIKQKGKISNIFLDLEKKKNRTKINQLDIKENNNLISLRGLEFNKDIFLLVDKISVKTFKDNIKNNDFKIEYGKKILIEGNKFDATNIPKIFTNKNQSNIFSVINKDIEINFKNILAPLSENLENFRLIGKLEKGKFVKISSKGNFGKNNILDISMKNDKKDKKYLEIYSDNARPLLTEFNFFKGLTGGKLLYTAVIEDETSSAKLRIENFKVINAPGMVKLLSLADLGGLADLAQGEGISFETLQINMEKNKNILTLNEILAIGPSISVLMEGYQDPTVISLRGTLVPAKTLNKLISKIPVIGNIVIPKEVGEGLFGVSFKMKGPPGKVKTTINPIRTITPRFIQKIVERKKKTKQPVQ